MGSTCCRTQTSSDDDELLTPDDSMSFCCFFRRSQVGENVSPTLQARKPTTTTSCKACKRSLSVFKRHKCADCAETHCADCLSLSSSDAAPSLTSSRPYPPPPQLCRKCGVLSSGSCTSGVLMTYTVHELRRYLERQDVSECNCTEKADLVELIIRIKVERGVISTEENDEHRRHVERLRERMLQDSQIFTTNRSSNRRLSRNSREFAPPTNQPVSIDSVVNPVVMTITDVGRSSSYRLRAPVQGSADGVVGDQEMKEGYAIQTGDNVGDIQTTQSGTGDEVTKESHERRISRSGVDLFTTVDRVDDMTVNQLRDVLTRNGVVLEEDAQLDKVSLVLSIRKLQFERSNEAAENPGIKQPPLCRLCACSPIDCVLLDCGHMVTCTGCAQTLPECPVCQQFVVRTVHVFRA